LDVGVAYPSHDALVLVLPLMADAMASQSGESCWNLVHHRVAEYSIVANGESVVLCTHLKNNHEEPRHVVSVDVLRTTVLRSPGGLDYGIRTSLG
jgi:hypothetical protein